MSIHNSIRLINVMLERIQKVSIHYFRQGNMNPKFLNYCLIIGCHGNPLCNNVSISPKKFKEK